MPENTSQFRLNFPQLILLLILQVGFIAGAFYLGTQFGSAIPLASEKNIENREIAKLLPQSEGSNTDASSSEKSTSPSKGAFSPFDKSSSAVFRIKSSSNTGYTVQVASYPDESAAAQVVEAWKKGYMAFLSVEEIESQGKWYRVNIGNFGDETSAQDFARAIQVKENITPQVVVVSE